MVNRNQPIQDLREWIEDVEGFELAQLGRDGIDDFGAAMAYLAVPEAS